MMNLIFDIELNMSREYMCNFGVRFLSLWPYCMFLSKLLLEDEQRVSLGVFDNSIIALHFRHIFVWNYPSFILKSFDLGVKCFRE